MKCLLSHAGEQNATRLGYGNGDNGKGNTVDGLLEIFQPLEQLIKFNWDNRKSGRFTFLLIPGLQKMVCRIYFTNILHEMLE